MRKNNPKQSEDCSEQQEHFYSPTISYLLRKNSSPNRKISIQSESDRPNFCCNVNTEQYRVIRVFINAISSKFIKLYYTKFTPTTKVGQICIIHSYGETSDDYLQISQYFAKLGYIVQTVDMRGFGYSGGSRANEPIRQVLSDIQNLLRFCCQKNVQTFILAHGLGALLVNALLQQNPHLPISGVIFLSPLMQFTNFNRNSLLHQIAVNSSFTIFDYLQISTLINPTALTKRPQNLKKKIESFFNQQFVSLKMVRQYAKISEKVRDQAYKFCYPLLICRGAKDCIQQEGQIRQFFNSCTSYDKEIKIFPEGYHALHNDYELEELQKVIKNWMQSRKSHIKWKNTNPFNLKNVIKRNYFRKMILILIGILLSFITIFKKLRELLKAN